MANYQNFKSVIVLDEDPLIKDPTVAKVSAIPKSTGADPAKLVSLEIYIDNKTKGIKYSVLQCPSVFVQTLGEMCLDTDIMHLYKHFVLCRSVLLSEYLREACAEHQNQKEGNVWNNRLFAIITKEFKN